MWCVVLTVRNKSISFIAKGEFALVYISVVVVLTDAASFTSPSDLTSFKLHVRVKLVLLHL